MIYQVRIALGFGQGSIVGLDDFAHLKYRDFYKLIKGSIQDGSINTQVGA